MSQPFSHVARAIQSLEQTGAKTATVFLSPKRVVKATRRFKKDRRERHAEYIVSVGTPNYAERQFIKDCIAAGERFPVRKVQLKAFPVRKR